MSVEETPVVADDTSVSDVTDTTADTSSDDDVELEDIEVSLEDISDESEVESKEEAKDESEESKDDTKESDEQSEDLESDDTETEKDGEDTDPKPTKEQVAHEAFKRREAERQLKAERDTRQEQDLKRYLDEAEGDEDELAKRQNEVERFNIKKEKSELTRDKLYIGIDRALADIDLFKSDDPIVREALASSLDDFETMYVTKDEKGNTLDVKADVYQYLQSKAESIRKLTGIGARQQAQQKSNQNSRTVTPPVKTPKVPKVDLDMDAFDEEANR